MKIIQDCRLVICDMAGTTVTDNHEVELCFSKAARQTGLEITDAEILAVQGWGKRHVFEVFWEKMIGARNEIWLRKVDRSFEVFRKILEEHYMSHRVTPTIGCMELFEFLKSNKVHIALTTGFYRKVADIILNQLGWMENGIVDFSVASDEVANGRPHADMIRKAMQTLSISDRKTVINIGDTPSDIQSGKNAGCLLSCCVTNGTHTSEQLAPFEADRSFGSMLDFRNWLERKLLR